MALDVKKGLGGVKLPTIPWGKLGKLSRLHKLLISLGIFGALFGCFVWFGCEPIQSVALHGSTNPVEEILFAGAGANGGRRC